MQKFPRQTSCPAVFYSDVLLTFTLHICYYKHRNNLTTKYEKMKKIALFCILLSSIVVIRTVEVNFENISFLVGVLCTIYILFATLRGQKRNISPPAG